MEILYHGSTVRGLKELQPFRETTPGELVKEDLPKAVYATDNPLAAVMFSFPWRSADGIDLQSIGLSLKLIVPIRHESRLHQPIVLYQVSAEYFSRIPGVSQEIGNFWAKTAVPVRGIEEFSDVFSGIARFGGIVEMI